MNNKHTKKSISVVILTVVLIGFIGGACAAHFKIRSYKQDVLADYTKLAELESEKSVLDIYNKISAKGSKESAQIKKYVLASDRKEVLALIDELETYGKRVGLTENSSSPIISVSNREDAFITKYNASDLVITLSVSGDERKINTFLDMLNNLPLVSYIEKIDTRYDTVSRKNTSTIVLIIYQKNEVQ